MTLEAKQLLQQRLLLTPNITLALEILRMPTLELQTFLHQQQQENPLLDVEDAEYDEEDRNQLSSADLGPWESSWRNGGFHERDPNDADNDKESLAAQRLSRPQTLHEWLLQQLGCHPMTPRRHELGKLLLEHLDESAYLEETLEALASESGASVAELDACLQVIQHFDPPGVGARNLRECLIIQLRQREASENGWGTENGAPASPPERLALTILQDHFELFVERRLTTLARALTCTLADVEAACDVLTHLNPKPGRAFSGDLPPIVIPDLIVRKREQHYDVELNDHGVPRVSMNRSYHQMLRDPATPNEARQYLQKKFRQASWIVKAIEERKSTLLAIGRCLISVQGAFIEEGLPALKPLTQAQVAELVGRHPSTVSRAITGKTIDTPCGVFSLEQLFASGVVQRTGAREVSDEAIKSEIQQLIAEEDASHSLSDEAIATRLAQRNLSVARRTVAKYRTSLKILPAHLRRRRI